MQKVFEKWVCFIVFSCPWFGQKIKIFVLSNSPFELKWNVSHNLHSSLINRCKIDFSFSHFHSNLIKKIQIKAILNPHAWVYEHHYVKPCFTMYSHTCLCRCFPDSLHFDGHLWWCAALLHGAGTGAVPQNRSHIHMETHLSHFQR